jgi:hypothetical protein
MIFLLTLNRRDGTLRTLYRLCHLGLWGFLQEFLGMCDYSLQNVSSRPAKVGDRLTTRNFGTGTRGFAAADDPTTAVCVLPGTELAFSEKVSVPERGLFRRTWIRLIHTMAIFRQVNKDDPYKHHDALEFPDGRVLLLTMLRDGQNATVLQLPAQPTTAAEEEKQRRVAYAG